MNEKWEMCLLISSELPVKHFKTIFTPSEVKRSVFRQDEFQKKICELLAEGWEPYHTVIDHIQAQGRDQKTTVNYFRRRVPSPEATS